MGNLTPIVLWNDYLDDLFKNPKEFVERIYSHASGGTQTVEDNEIKLFRPIHSHDRTIYVSMGNTVSELNVYSPETRNLMQVNPEFLQHMLNYAEWQVKELKKEYSSLH